MATDLSRLLRRQGLDFEPTQVAWERVVDAAARRRRNRRVGSALVALVLFAVSDAALLGVLRSSHALPAPAGGYLNPTTGSSVVVPGGSGAGSIPGEDQQVGSAGGRLRNSDGVGWGAHPATPSTPARSGIGPGHRPNARPANDGGRRSPDRRSPPACGGHRFHGPCRPPSEKWRPPASRGLLAPMGGPTHISISTQAVRPTTSAGRARTARSRASRLLHSRVAPRRAGPAVAG
jgi:hypothetical protein